MENIIIPYEVAEWYEHMLDSGRRSKFSADMLIETLHYVYVSSKERNRSFTTVSKNIPEAILSYAVQNTDNFVYLLTNCNYRKGYESTSRTYLIKVPKVPKLYYALDKQGIVTTCKESDLLLTNLKVTFSRIEVYEYGFTSLENQLVLLGDKTIYEYFNS